ncbi:MAG: hypothetical protein QMB82_09230, partial [Bacteroidales bacterium]
KTTVPAVVELIATLPKFISTVLVIPIGVTIVLVAVAVAVTWALEITDTPEKRIAIAKNLIAFMIVIF